MCDASQEPEGGLGVFCSSAHYPGKVNIYVVPKAVDPDPHGSAFIFPIGENLREKTEKMQ